MALAGYNPPPKKKKKKKLCVLYAVAASDILYGI